jgi:quinoprotein relay system zinc metallohydrolase 2
MAEQLDFALQEPVAGLFVHLGRSVDTDDPARADMANIGFIVGRDCVAVIDTGGSVAVGAALRARIRHETALPIRFVINTHGHFDHALGNAAFLDDRPEFIGHAELATVLGGSEDFFRKNFAEELRGAPDPGIVLPTRTVKDVLEIDLGGRVLRLRAQASAHSQADLTVEDVASGTLWTGDLLFRERLPVLDGSLRGWQAWMRTSASSVHALVIPGHGPMARDWPETLAPQEAYLASLERTVGTAIGEGQFLEDLLADAPRSVPAGWQITRPHARNLVRAWRELEWE